MHETPPEQPSPAVCLVVGGSSNTTTGRDGWKCLKIYGFQKYEESKVEFSGELLGETGGGRRFIQEPNKSSLLVSKLFTSIVSRGYYGAWSVCVSVELRTAVVPVLFYTLLLARCPTTNGDLKRDPTGRNVASITICRDRDPANIVNSTGSDQLSCPGTAGQDVQLNH